MSEALALQLLGNLADRIESRPDRRNRVSVTLPKRSFLAADKEALEDTLRQAEAAGAVELVWGRHELRHLIDKVVLVDAGRLYDFLGRQPARDLAAGSAERVRTALCTWWNRPLPAYAEAVLTTLEADWTLRKRPQGLGPADWPEVLDVVKGVIAVKEQSAGALDLRSFSTRATGSSKLIEQNKGRIASWLRRIDDLPGYLDDADAVLASYGLMKFALPILVAGPLSYRGTMLAQEPYAGLAPEVAGAVTAAGGVAALLTIENLASFNRHVRDARRADELVIFSGGFPSRHTMAFVARLAAETGAACFHWGDIDLGGIRIAHHIHRNLPAGLRLHLMSEELAITRGAATTPIAAAGIPTESPVASLAAFLASKRAHSLEQEELDPQHLDEAAALAKGSGRLL